MTDLDRIRLHIEQARLLFQLAGTVITFGGENADVDHWTKQANDHLDAAHELMQSTHPAVAYLSVGRGVLSGLDEYNPAEWARVWDEGKAQTVTVHWSQIGGVK